MESKVAVFCLLAIHLLLLVFTVEGAIWRSNDPCPEPYKKGDTWNLENCQQCQCLEHGYECYSCGVTSYQGDTTKCYTYTNKEQSYPKCCQVHIKCRGDEGFDENALIG